MFNFTTTHVINSNYDLSSNTPLWILGTDTFTVKGVNTFKKENVEAAYKAAYNDAVMAQITIDFSKAKINGAAIEDGEDMRLYIPLYLSTSSDLSYYANDTNRKGKVLSVDFKYNAAKPAESLKKLIDKFGLFKFEKDMVKVTVPEDTKLVITATTEFQRFDTPKLQYYVASDVPYKDGYYDVTDGSTVTDKLFTMVDGHEAFGSYDYILRNIKLPTHEATRAFGINQHENPVPGAKYDQYIIRYCVNRGPLGLNAVGDQVKSETTHVFFVNRNIEKNTTDKDAFKALDGEGQPDATVEDANVADFDSAFKAFAGDKLETYTYNASKNKIEKS